MAIKTEIWGKLAEYSSSLEILLLLKNFFCNFKNLLLKFLGYFRNNQDLQFISVCYSFYENNLLFLNDIVSSFVVLFTLLVIRVSFFELSLHIRHRYRRLVSTLQIQSWRLLIKL